MPKVSQYGDQQVTTNVTSQPRASAAAGSAVFDKNIQVAQGVAKLGNATGELMQRLDTTAAEEALVQFERSKNDLFFNPESGYFNTQGKNAYDAAAPTSESMAELKKQYGESLNTNSRAMFDKSADLHITRSQADIARHSSKGLKAWEVSTVRAQVENSVENASLYWNQPDRLRVQNALGRQAVIDAADLEGISAEAKNERLQTFDSSFTKTAITSAIASSSAEGAVMLEKQEGKLEGPDKIKLEGMIASKAKAEKTQADSTYAVVTAKSLVEKYDNKADAHSTIDHLADTDPDKYKKTRAEINAQFALKKQADKQSETDAYHAVVDMVNKSNMTVAQIQAADIKTWDAMNPLQRNMIQSGKHRVTDQITLSDVRSLPPAQLAGVDVNDYADKLNVPDYKALAKDIERAKKGMPNSSVQTLNSKSTVAAEQNFGPRKKWKLKNGKLTEKGKNAQEFLNDLQVNISAFEDAKGSKITPTEEDKILADMTRDFYVTRTGLFGADFLAKDVNLNMNNTPREDIKILNQIADHFGDSFGEDERTKLARAYQSLIEDGKVVNGKNLQDYFYKR